MSCYGHEDTAQWTKWEDYCSECGKLHIHNRVYTYWFDTMDGGDSFSTCVCWKCEVKGWIKRKFIYPIKKAFKRHKLKKGLKADLKKLIKKYTLTPLQIEYYKEFIDRQVKEQIR